MGIESGKIFSFNTGIEQILANVAEDTKLPDSTFQLIPSQVQPDNHLDRLFSAKGLEELAIDALMPELIDRELLIPERYKRRLQDSIDALKKEASLHKGKDGENIFNAARMLEGEQELSKTLSMFRNLLIRA